MKITMEMARAWGACSSGVDWFGKNFPDGGEYQTVLDALAEADQPSWASWLMSKAGADTEAVLELESVSERKHLFFAGSIVVKVGISVSGCLLAGWGIEAGDGIKAGWGIGAGWGIKAGDGIKAGSGMGIFAGLRVRLTMWAQYAIVTAKTKPENLISGHWVKAKK